MWKVPVFSVWCEKFQYFVHCSEPLYMCSPRPIFIGRRTERRKLTSGNKARKVVEDGGLVIPAILNTPPPYWALQLHKYSGCFSQLFLWRGGGLLLGRAVKYVANIPPLSDKAGRRGRGGQREWGRTLLGVRNCLGLVCFVFRLD